MDIVNDQRHRLGELFERAEQEVVGRSAVLGEALVQGHQGIIAGERELTRRSLNRPDNTVKEPCRLGIESVQRQPGALQVAFPDPITQKELICRSRPGAATSVSR